MSPIRYDETVMRLIRDVNEIKSALRRTVANLPLFDIANENTPASISTDQDNYIPGNYDVLRLNATADVSITGFANGVKGRFLEIINVGTGRISFPDENTNSIAVNRIATPYDQTVTLLPNARVRFYYDSTRQRWTVSDLPNIQGQFGKYAILAGDGVFWQTIAADTYTRINPPTVLTDEWGYWDSANKKFTIPSGESGFYVASLTFQIDGGLTQNYTAFDVRKNPTGSEGLSGTSLYFHQYYQYVTILGTYRHYVNLNLFFDLESGDSVTFVVENSIEDGVFYSVSANVPVMTFSKVG